MSCFPLVDQAGWTLIQEDGVLVSPTSLNRPTLQNCHRLVYDSSVYSQLVPKAILTLALSLCPNPNPGNAKPNININPNLNPIKF